MENMSFRHIFLHSSAKSRARPADVKINRPPMDRADRLALEPKNCETNPTNPDTHPGSYEIDPKIPPFPEAQDYRNTTFAGQQKTVEKAPVGTPSDWRVRQETPRQVHA
jgi:hypothetical protein